MFEVVSIVAWLGVLVIVYRCFSRYGHHVWGAATTLSMTVTANYQRYATEIRPYALAALIVSALFLLSLDRTRLGRRVGLVLVLLAVGPFVHPLLTPLVLYFTFVFARAVGGRMRWLMGGVGLSSSFVLVALTRTNPRGDDQLFWMGKGSLRDVIPSIVRWFASTGAVGIDTSTRGKFGLLIAFATFLLFIACMSRIGFFRVPSGAHTLFVASIIPLALEVGIIGSWSVVGSHNYTIQTYKYFYPVLPLWTIVSSCALLSVLVFVREWLQERRRTVRTENVPGWQLASRPITVILVILSAAAGLNAAWTTVRRTQGTVTSSVFREPAIPRYYIAEDLVKFLPKLPELAQGNLRVGLSIDDFDFTDLQAAKGLGRLKLPKGVELREPFDNCVLPYTGLPPSVRVNAPVSVWGDVFASSRPPVDLRIIVNSGSCVQDRIRALPEPKVFLSYDSATRTYAVTQRTP